MAQDRYAPPPSGTMDDEIRAALGKLRTAGGRPRPDLLDRDSVWKRASGGLRGQVGGGGAESGPPRPEVGEHQDGRQLDLEPRWPRVRDPRMADVRSDGRDGTVAKADPAHHGFGKMSSSDTYKLFIIFCLIVGIFGAIVSSFIGSNAGEQAALRILNVKPAMAFHDIKLRTPIIRNGDPLELTYSYDKRAECSPPDGEGEFLFKIYQGAIIKRVADGLLVDELASGVNLGPVVTTLPKLPDLLPGSYKLGMRGVFVCVGERDAQIITPEKLSFEVIP